MKKFLWVIVIALALLAVTPFAIGRFAAQRIDRGLDQLVMEAPYLRIADRKYHSGWFTSDMDVTVELFPGFLPGANGASAPRLTVHNDIQHGPILGSGIGMARIKTHFVMSAATRSEVEKLFGTDEPFQITSTIGFLGGGTTVVSSDARKVEKDGDRFEWEALKVVVDVSSSGDTYAIDGKWPRLMGHDKSGSDFSMKGLRIKGTGKRLIGDLYDGDFDFVIDELEAREGASQTFRVENAHYSVATEPQGEFVDLGIKMGTGLFESPKFNFKEVHYDFSLRRLHAATLAKLLSAVKAAYQKPMENAADLQAAILAPYKEHGIELLKHDPEFVIDHLGISMDEGDAVIKGVIRFKGVTAQDLEAGAIGLLPKIAADLDIGISEAVIQKLSGSTEAADGAVAQGVLERKDGRLLSKIGFHDGHLLINGTEKPLPGLGGPPPAAPSQE